jgi:hypothetical protein
VPDPPGIATEAPKGYISGAAAAPLEEEVLPFSLVVDTRLMLVFLRLLFSFSQREGLNGLPISDAAIACTFRTLKLLASSRLGGTEIQQRTRYPEGDVSMRI